MTYCLEGSCSIQLSYRTDTFSDKGWQRYQIKIENRAGKAAKRAEALDVQFNATSGFRWDDRLVFHRTTLIANPKRIYDFNKLFVPLQSSRLCVKSTATEAFDP
jgi:hypothetical protein